MKTFLENKILKKALEKTASRCLVDEFSKKIAERVVDGVNSKCDICGSQKDDITSVCPRCGT